MASKKNICVIGLGYIGLPTASLLATKGYDVLGVDVSPQIIDTINSGKIHIVEPELDILVKSAVQSGKLKASLKVEAADVFILAVPTPFKEDHLPDLCFVEQASRNVASVLKSGDVIILESTSPVGTTEKVASWIAEERGHSEDLYFAHCPERVLPGHILRELVENDRVIGGVTPEATQKATEFYMTFVSGAILQTDAKTAEMAKLVENSFRDVNIAFANELSMICEEHNINVWELIKLANHHPRVNILQPGPGVGGHCIAVDPWFIVHASPKTARLIRVAREINDFKPDWVVKKIKDKAKRFRDPVIACLGLAYKNDIDDLRESPSLLVAKNLKEQNIGKIIACEPNVNSKQVEGIPLYPLMETLDQSDIIVILVNHQSFYNIDRKLFDEKVVIDTLGISNI